MVMKPLSQQKQIVVDKYIQFYKYTQEEYHAYCKELSVPHTLDELREIGNRYAKGRVLKLSVNESIMLSNYLLDVEEKIRDGEQLNYRDIGLLNCSHPYTVRIEIDNVVSTIKRRGYVLIKEQR